MKLPKLKDTDKEALIFSHVNFLGFSLAVFTWLVASEHEEFSAISIGVLLIALFVINVLQIGFVAVTRRRVFGLFSEKVADQCRLLLLSVFVASNAYYFAYVTTDSDLGIKLLFSLTTGSLFYVFHHFERLNSFAFMFVCAFIIMSAATYTWNSIDSATDDVAMNTEGKHFVEKKNVYVVSFDALHSKEALRTLYEGAVTSHYDYLSENGFRMFEQAYSAAQSTNSTFVHMLEFDSVDPKISSSKSVVGGSNTTYREFLYNGYKIQFVFGNNYFGHNTGGLDFYFPEPGFSICVFLPKEFFYGLCSRPMTKILDMYFPGLRSRYSNDEQIDVLRDRISVSANDDSPWFTMTYIHYPGHVNIRVHRYDDMQSREKEVQGMLRRLPRVRSYLERTVGYILELDPDSIVVVFGDHGAWLSYGMSDKERLEGNEYFDTKEAIEDYYGVVLGVYPADFCRNRIYEGISTQFLFRSVIDCLAQNDIASEEEIRDNRQIWLRKRRIDVGDVLGYSHVDGRPPRMVD